MGGEIKCKSEIGKGTKFTFFVNPQFYKVIEDETDFKIEETSTSLSTLYFNQQLKRILIVDDNFFNIEVLQTIV